MKIFRPGGIIVFALVGAGAGAFWFLASGWLVKTAIEEVGTRTLGARVELVSAKLSLSPLGVRLEGLQLTNPEQPMQNLAEFKSIEANLEPIKALMGQVIIDDLRAGGVRFNTPRTRSGEIKTAPARQNEDHAAEASALDLGSVTDTLPSVEDILAREPLTTLTKTAELKNTISAKQNELQRSVSALPTEDSLDQYERRIKQLTTEKIAGVDELHKRKEELDKLKDDIRNDKQAIDNVRNQVRDTQKSLTAQYNDLKNAPKEDLDRIMARYGLDSAGAANITRLLFGDKAKHWLETAQTWYARLKSVMPAGNDAEPTSHAPEPSRGTGRFIHFPTTHPSPDFLVRRARVDAELPLGQIDFQLADITHQPHILGRPMTLKASGEKLPAAEKITLDGVFDHIKPSAGRDKLDWTVSGWKVADVTLSRSGTLPLQLSRAVVDIRGDLDLSGAAVQGAAAAKFTDAAWHSEAAEGWGAQVGKTLSTIRNFTLTGKVEGDFQSPNISIKSDLDEQIKTAAMAQLKTKQAQFEQKLKARLEQELQQSAGPYKEQLAALSQTEGTLAQRIEKMEQMLKAEMQSAVDSKKQETEQKLKDKLKGLKF